MRFKRLTNAIRLDRSDRSFRGWYESILRVHPFVISRALYGWRQPWLGKFVREIWRFRTARQREVILHYAPELWHEVLPEIFLVQLKDELKALERKFSFRLPRASVFLFPAAGSITELFGSRYAGGALALPSFDAIVVSEHANDEEDVRHELVHLFAARWNRYAPPLLSEGLAVHLQRRWQGYPIAAYVRRFGNRSEWTLSSFFDESYFYDSPYRRACYGIAGSFTGFLIDQFGWDAYRSLYRSCRPNRVERAIKRSLGISFSEAEARWRNWV